MKKGSLAAGIMIGVVGLGIGAEGIRMIDAEVSYAQQGPAIGETLNSPDPLISEPDAEGNRELGFLLLVGSIALMPISASIAFSDESER